MMPRRGSPGLLSWTFVLAVCIVFAREAPLLLIAMVIFAYLRKGPP